MCISTVALSSIAAFTLDAFSDGLVHMANYLGNIILPISAGLVVAVGVFVYSKRGDGSRYIIGALACLLVSGFVRQAEAFIGSSSDSSMFYEGIIGLVNWTCNIILPFYSVFCFAKGAMAIGWLGDNFNISDDYSRNFIAGFGCLMCSGIVRLMEYFIIAALKGGTQ